MDYVAAPSAVTLPDGVTMGATAAVAFDARGHLWVLTRGAVAFFEFDEKGAYVRSFGDKLFTRAHGLRIDREGNLWAGDVGAHTVRKFSRDGQVLLTLGTAGEAGEWNEAAGSRKLNQPNDVVVADNGDIFIAQGHTPGPKGDARVLKFDKTGKLAHAVGRQGHRRPASSRWRTAWPSTPRGCCGWPTVKTSASSCSISSGTFVREMKYAGLPCAMDIGREYIYMVNGFAGQVVRMDLSGQGAGGRRPPRQGPWRVRRGALHRGEPEAGDLRRRFGQRRARQVRQAVLVCGCAR